MHEIEIAPDVTDLLPAVVDLLDEPIGDPAAINTLLICEAARDAGVKVLLSGMGADELFGGYRKHLACVTAAQYQRLPRPLRKGVVRPAVDRMPVAVGDAGPADGAVGETLPDVRGPAGRSGVPPELHAVRRRTHSRRCSAPSSMPYVADVIDEHRAIYDDSQLPDHVNRMCLADARLFLPGLNLAYTDRASMAASTEVRVPFVDVEVVRAAFSQPGRAKVEGPLGKGRAQARRRGVVAEGDRVPAEGIVRRAAARVDLSRSQ